MRPFHELATLSEKRQGLRERGFGFFGDQENLELWFKIEDTDWNRPTHNLVFVDTIFEDVDFHPKVTVEVRIDGTLTVNWWSGSGDIEHTQKRINMMLLCVKYAKEFGDAG